VHRGPLPCTLSVRFLHSHGRSRLGDRWKALVEAFTASLDRAANGPALEGGESRKRWTFPDLPVAYDAWQKALNRVPAAHSWKPAHGALPLQALLDLDTPEETGGDEEAPWEVLPPEALHLTAALHHAWELLVDREHDGALALVKDRAGPFYRIADKAGEEPRALVLFPGRLLPIRQPGRRCFCCGHTGHRPAACPSKLLGPEVHGLALAGYQSLPELALHYEKAFADEDHLLQVLRDGVEPALVRSDPLLQAYLATFDLTRTFQLRTLLYLCFVRVDSWPGIGPLGRAKPTPGNTLHLALDCLRVGKLAQAVGLLRSLEGVDREDRFYVEVGLAFAALEQDDPRTMRAHLDQARKLALRPEQRTYAALLRSRFQELYGGEADRELAVSAALDAAGRCPEVAYRVFQLTARAGLADGGLDPLRALLRWHREYFLVALLDPDLAGICGPVEAVLAALLEDTLGRGQHDLDRLREESAALRDWLGDGDSALGPVLAGVASLQQRARRESYFGFADINAAADKLLISCKDVKERRVRRLHHALDSLRRRGQALAGRWRDYPCKRFYKRYPEELRDLSGAVRRAEAPLAGGRTQDFKEVEALLERAQAHATSLEKLWPEMTWLWNTLEFARRFVGRLAITEAVAVVLSLLALPLVSTLQSRVGGVLSNTALRSMVFFALVFFLAPAFAMLITFVSGSKVKVPCRRADP